MPEDERNNWNEILGVLDERISDVDSLNVNDLKPILIAYNIMEKELDLYCDAEA